MRGVQCGSSPDIRLAVQKKFADLNMMVCARRMKGSIIIAAAKYGIRKIEHGAGGAGAIESAGVQKGVIQAREGAVGSGCLANAVRVCDAMILHEREITRLRRAENVGACNASSSSSLETRVSWGCPAKGDCK